MSATESARTNVQERETKQRERLAAVGAKTDDTKGIISPEKDKRHIRWADDSGKALAIPHEKGADPPKEAETEKSPQDPRHGRPSWSDRKKKDLLHEKELLLHAR